MTLHTPNSQKHAEGEFCVAGQKIRRIANLGSEYSMHQSCFEDLDRRIFLIAGLFVVNMIALAPEALAAADAVRGPALPNGENEVASTSSGGVLDLNPGRTQVSADVGFDSVTSIRVDADNGTIGGYAEFDMDQDRTVPAAATVGSGAQGILTLEATVVADSGTPTGPAEMVVEFMFDGRFEPTDQMPSLSLAGDVAVTQLAPGFPPSGVIYQSLLAFFLNVANPAYELETTTLGTQAVLFGGGSMPFDGASAEVVSSDLENLVGIVRLTVPVEEGDTVSVNAVLNGIATAQPGDTPAGDTLDIRASSGFVDFSNTGELTIFLPEGFSLEGDDPLLDAIVVPEPSLGALLVSGCLVLLALQRSVEA